MDTSKAIHTVILDAGPIIKNEPPIATLRNKAEQLVTTHAFLTEIRDAATRSRVETTLMPFLTLREPKTESLKVITDFARRTGDLAVLSKPDIQILALAYEIECERNGGDWRLRRVPGQKRTNGPPPSKKQPKIEEQSDAADAQQTAAEHVQSEEHVQTDLAHTEHSQQLPYKTSEEPLSEEIGRNSQEIVDNTQETVGTDSLIERLESNLASTTIATPDPPRASDQLDLPELSEDHDASASASEDSDSEGWITPSNLSRKRAQDTNAEIGQSTEPKTMQAATITTDFAMQNVLLQMNLNLLSSSMQRVKHLKTFVLRCHACFDKTKDMSKQFCPRCGKPTLTRVACSTNANGEFKMHLKKNMQWNTRGDRFSIPKPVAGSANGKVKGGGKGGWGNELMLAEDQKEYVRAVAQEKKQNQRDLMDEDYLPGILTGDRGRAGGRPKVGAGRNVNSKKR